MSTKKFPAVLKNVTTVQVTTGEHATEKSSAAISVEEIDRGDDSIRLSIPDQWLKASDLREAAELFNAMADALES